LQALFARDDNFDDGLRDPTRQALPGDQKTESPRGLLPVLQQAGAA
jgi:hypothetical protein